MSGSYFQPAVSGWKSFPSSLIKNSSRSRWLYSDPSEFNMAKRLIINLICSTEYSRNIKIEALSYIFVKTEQAKLYFLKNELKIMPSGPLRSSYIFYHSQLFFFSISSTFSRYSHSLFNNLNFSNKSENKTSTFKDRIDAYEYYYASL